MTMLLSDARTRVLNYLDDDNTRWSNSEIDQKLRLAIESCCTVYAAKGGTRLDEVVSITTSTDGYADLTSVKPLQIQAVRLNQGGWFTPIASVTARDFLQRISSALPLEIRLVRSPTLPTSASDNILYGPNLSFETMDELICLKAARLLLTKDRELDQSLEIQFQELLQTTLATENIQQCYDLPIANGNGTVNQLCYTYLPYGLYLGRKVV